MKRILLTHWRAPGDIVCMTACVRDLALSYPGVYEIHVSGSCGSLWENNPHVAKFWGAAPPCDIPTYRLSYLECLRQSGHQRLHFLAAFHHDLGKKLGVPVPVLCPKGDLHLDARQRLERPIKAPYWYLVAGGKTGITTKLWSLARFQQVVDLLRERGIHIFQGGASYPGHQHRALSGVVDLIGRTSLRDVLWLIYHAEGVICPVTFAMHVAAAFDKPCVVLGGGREPWWWEAYVNSPDMHFGPACSPVTMPHQYFHAIGLLACCRETGCWRTQVDPVASSPVNLLCSNPADDGCGQLIPACLDLVSVEMIVEAVLQNRRSAARGRTAERSATVPAGRKQPPKRIDAVPDVTPLGEIKNGQRDRCSVPR